MRRTVQPSAVANALDEGRLGDTGHPFEQHVTARRAAPPSSFERASRTDVHAGDLAADRLEALSRGRDLVDHGGCTMATPPPFHGGACAPP